VSRYDLVVFDWDGTIADSTGIIASSIREACRDLGLPIPPEEDARWVIGLGYLDSMNHVAPGLSPKRQRALAERYRAHYLAREDEVLLFEGIMPLIAELRARERLVAVATGKARRGLDRALAASGLGPFFDATRCGDEGFPKPHPDMLLHLLEATGVAPERAVMIGDTTHDLELAANAGVEAVAVCYGAHDEKLLRARKARHFARDVGDLRKWLADNA
jgi:phosphoglycolate phosphatase